MGRATETFETEREGMPEGREAAICNKVVGKASLEKVIFEQSLEGGQEEI